MRVSNIKELIAFMSQFDETVSVRVFDSKNYTYREVKVNIVDGDLCFDLDY